MEATRNQPNHKPVHHHSGIAGWYTYRGITMKRNDSERGYWGHWYADIVNVSDGDQCITNVKAETRARLMAKIDELLDGSR